MEKMANSIGKKIVEAKDVFDSNKMNDPDNASPVGSESSEKDKDVYDRVEDFVITDLQDKHVIEAIDEVILGVEDK